MIAGDHTKTLDQIRATTWHETKALIGPYEEFDEEVRVWLLREETMRVMTIPDFKHTPVRTMDIIEHFQEGALRELNPYRAHNLVMDALARLSERGVIYPCYDGIFSNNPTHQHNAMWTKLVLMRASRYKEEEELAKVYG